jgi:hypothetical protein
VDQTNGMTRSTVNGATTMNSRQASESDVPSDASASTRHRRPSTMQVTPTVTSQSENALSQSKIRLWGRKMRAYPARATHTAHTTTRTITRTITTS